MALTAFVPNMDEPAKRPAGRAQSIISSSRRNIALLGFGTVGRAVAEILCRTPQPHLRLIQVFNRNVERKRAAWVPDGVRWTENFREVLASDADIVVELIGGVEPAHEFIRQALLSGKSVVTANKHLIAKYGPELVALAHRSGQHLEYGASVGGSVPILAALQHGLAGDHLFRALGILNGTCNYILSKMEASKTTLAEALAEAQKLGYAESDPSDDINGLDAACKLAIVARAAFHAELNAFEIPRQSIREVQPVDFRFAKKLGCTIRQISLAHLEEKHLHAAVGPALVPLNSPFAGTVENQNAMVVTGEQSGDTMLAGRGAGGGPTAVAVVSDLLAITHGANGAGSRCDREAYPCEEPLRRHYLRVAANNRTDMPRLVSRVVTDLGIVIEKWLHSSGKKNVEAVCVTGKCPTGAVQKAIGQLATLEGISGRPLALPIIS